MRATLARATRGPSDTPETFQELLERVTLPGIGLNVSVDD